MRNSANDQCNPSTSAGGVTAFKSSSARESCGASPARTVCVLNRVMRRQECAQTGPPCTSRVQTDPSPGSRNTGPAVRRSESHPAECRRCTAGCSSAGTRICTPCFPAAPDAKKTFIKRYRTMPHFAMTYHLPVG